MNNANPSKEEWVEIKGKKYRIDGEFYISKDESYVLYSSVKYNWFDKAQQGFIRSIDAADTKKFTNC